jgi:hypothetical protein
MLFDREIQYSIHELKLGLTLLVDVSMKFGMAMHAYACAHTDMHPDLCVAPLWSFGALDGKRYMNASPPTRAQETRK